MTRWWLVEQQQIFNIITYWLTDLLTKVLLGTPPVSINEILFYLCFPPESSWSYQQCDTQLYQPSSTEIWLREYQQICLQQSHNHLIQNISDLSFRQRDSWVRHANLQLMLQKIQGVIFIFANLFYNIFVKPWTEIICHDFAGFCFINLCLKFTLT